MASNLRVGDVCEVVGSLNCPEVIGKECTIIGPLESLTIEYDTRPRHRVSINGYDETAPNGKLWAFRPEYLRLKRPPSWDRWITDTSGVRDERYPEQHDEVQA